MHSAVFVDFENLFQSLQGREELTGQRIRELCLGILEHLKERLRRESAPMLLGRSYAAFDTYPGMEVAHELALMGFEPQYVLIAHAAKNSADVQLACDVCRVLYRRPDIDSIVIVSGDRDFIPIARQVLEENRELRVVAIPDSTSGDLRMRVGRERYWNALELIAAETGNGDRVPVADVAARTAEAAESAEVGARATEPIGGAPNGAGNGNGHVDAGVDGRASPRLQRGRAAIVGHIPVTWRTADHLPADGIDGRLRQCIDLILRAQIRHGSPEVWLSPFLKGAMSQHFSELVHPERRALINELRQRGVIRIEERANQYADHPYSVIVLDAAHPMVADAADRARRREEAR